MLAFLTVEEHLEGFRLKFKDGETVDDMHTIMSFQKFWIILYTHKYHGSSYTYCVHMCICRSYNFKVFNLTTYVFCSLFLSILAYNHKHLALHKFLHCNSPLCRLLNKQNSKPDTIKLTLLHSYSTSNIICTR